MSKRPTDQPFECYTNRLYIWNSAIPLNDVTGFNPKLKEPYSHVMDGVVWSYIFFLIKSSPPSAAYMRQCRGSALVQIMACRLYGAEPLSKPMMGYCELDPYEQTSVKFQSKYFCFTKMHIKISSAKWRTFCQVGDELRPCPHTYTVIKLYAL